MLYKAQLQAIDPAVEYLMTLYLSPDLTPDEVHKAARAGIVGAPIVASKLCTIVANDNPCTQA